MEFLKIWLVTILLAIVYGISHDMVTAHVCVEYFTIGHAGLFGTEQPVLLAIGWGAVATWWVGLILGVAIAASAQLGNANRLALGDLLRPAVVLLLSVGVTSLAFGVVGYALARADVVALSGVVARDVPPQSLDRFMADAWAHTAAYGAGAFGSLVLCGWIIARRVRAGRQGATPRAPRPAPAA